MDSIDATLKLVIERARESDGAPFYAYSQSVSRNTAKRYWNVIQAAVASLYASGNPFIAPKFAADAIRAAARGLGIEDDVERNFIGEIRRLTTVVAPGEAGWDYLTLEDAAKGVLSEDELDEVESAACFFTLAWRFHSTQDRQKVVSGAVTLWKGRLTSSTFMEFTASLKPSTGTDASGGKTAPARAKDAMGLSVPS